MIQIAQRFGNTLDEDNFGETITLLSLDCIYHIGEKTLHRPEEIVDSYRQNMIEG